MNNKFIKYATLGLLLVLILTSVNFSFGKDKTQSSTENWPIEKMTVHLTQECIFPEEILWFKIYCSSSLFPETELSRLAFIELVSPDNASLLRKKILLTNGVGNGEFLIPNDLASGVYYILAYTNWMKNFGPASFYKKELTIINPNEEFEYIESSVDLTSEAIYKSDAEEKIKIAPERTQYSTREKVKLHFENIGEPATISNGSFSISVVQKSPKMHAKGRFKSDDYEITKPDSIISLPDYSGIRLTGNISDDTGNPIKEELISISYPGVGTEIDGTKTDKYGNFHFLLEPKEGEKDLVFVLPASNLKLRLAEPFQNGLIDPPAANPLIMDENTITFLKERNAHFQLQKKFKQKNFTEINQAITVPNSNYRFYGEAEQVIELNEYIELDSLTEYFWELIPSVKFTPKRGNYNILVIDPVSYYPFKDTPGVFIDGVLYNDYNEIAEIPVAAVSQLAIVDKTYYYREFTFGGIVDIHTKQNNFDNVRLLPNMVRMMYPLGSQAETEFVKITHPKTGLNDKIPDMRYLLCWEPEIKIDQNEENTVEFYTSDIEGDYLVKVIGLSADGNILEYETEITVKANMK